MTLTLTSTLTPRNSSDALLTAIPVRLLSAPRREIGLTSQGLALAVSAADWPAAGPTGADLSKPMRLVFGYDGEGEPDQVITLDGLMLQQATPISFGVPVTTPGALTGSGTSVPQEVQLALTTLPSFWGDGRGGIIKVGVLNPLKADGTVDVDSPHYRTNTALALLCVQAMGLNDDYIDPALDDYAPVGPLDWGNASAQVELEALCARLGAVVVLGYLGTSLSVVVLPRAGSGVSLGAYEDIANPYRLQSSRAVRGTTVCVLSGATRTTVVTTRDLSAFEWVWRSDDGAWLNATQTASPGPGGIAPDDITSWRAAPGTDPEKRAEFNRLFRALRLKAADRERMGRLTTMDAPRAVGSGQTVTPGSPARVTATSCVPMGQSRFAASAGKVITGVTLDERAGVLVMPSGVAMVKPATPGQAEIGYGESAALEAADVSVTFAYESNERNLELDYYVAAWSFAVGGGGALVPTRLTGAALTAALADPATIKLQAPFIRRVVVRALPGDAGTEANNTVNDAIALDLARSRAATGLAQSGVVRLRGMINALPGFSPAAISSVEWDLARNETILQLNEHEAPQSFYDRAELEAQRSLVAGLWRGGQITSVAAGLLPQVGPERDANSRVTTRGDEARLGSAQAAGGSARPIAPAQELAHGDTGTRWWARITASAASGGAGSNKWTYSWQEVGYIGGVWATVANGRTHATSGYSAAVNGMESANASTGKQGNGITVANLCAGITIQPVETGTVVEMVRMGAAVVFSSPNGVDGGTP